MNANKSNGVFGCFFMFVDQSKLIIFVFLICFQLRYDTPNTHTIKPKNPVLRYATADSGTGIYLFFCGTSRNRALRRGGGAQGHIKKLKPKNPDRSVRVFICGTSRTTNVIN